MSDIHAQQGFHAPEPAALSPLFPGYEIESLIATGGMGAVYCAVQKSLDRTVALKILPVEFSQDASFCAGFEAEAKAMARLNHPNLIGVYDFGEAGGMLYIIMEYVPGKSVYDSAYGIAIDPAEVVRLVTGICNGLEHAHQHGIIHRDIKPANVLLDLSAEPKIGDFGLARPVERKFEEGEGIFGTPHYTAPEVINDPHSVDYRADIFSVGVLLHELLTSKLPADDPRPASTIVHCDSRFDTIIRRATQPDPLARYLSAKDLARDLQVIGESLARKNPTTGAANIPSPHPASRARGRKKSKTSVITSFLGSSFVLALFAVGAYFFFSKPQQVKLSEQALLVLTPPPNNQPPKTEVGTTNSAVIPEANPSNVTPPGGKKPDRELDDKRSTTDVPPTETPETEPTGSEVAMVPEATPEPSVIAPRFDVTGFFERGRRIMQEKSVPYIQTAQKNLAANLSDFERELKRLVRKEKIRDFTIEDAIEKQIESWHDEGARIPGSILGRISLIAGIEEVAGEHLKIQTGIDDTLSQQLGSLAPTYILGLEKQIERLQPDNDVGAISLIEDEIKATKDDADYFPDLMLKQNSTEE
jgi:serine/threonine protein kinase